MRSSLTKKQTEEVSQRLDGKLSSQFLNDLSVVLDVIDDVKAETPTRKVQKTIDKTAVSLATMLKEYVLELYPYYEKQISIEKWANDIRLMNTADGVEYRAIEAIIRYLFEMYSPNSDFDWREQIRSGRNLRKHWIRLYELAKKDYENFNIETV